MQTGDEQSTLDRTPRGIDCQQNNGGDNKNIHTGVPDDCSTAIADAVGKALAKALEQHISATALTPDEVQRAAPCPSPTPLPPSVVTLQPTATLNAATSQQPWMPEPIRVVSVRSLPIWEAFEMRWIFSEQREFKVTRVGWDEAGKSVALVHTMQCTLLRRCLLHS